MTAWRPDRLRWLGLGAVWLAAILAAPSRESSGGQLLAVWLANLALFSILFWFASDERCASWSPVRRLALLAALSLSGIALVAYGGALAATCPVVTAALAGSTLGRRAAWALVAVQTALLAGAFLLARATLAEAVPLALVFGGLQLFVVHTAQIANAEGAARRALEEAHRELEAAQAELAGRSRDAERVRIAGDLHDLLGHHLTAMSLTLEGASHGGAEAKATAIDEALVLTKRVLRDVRRAVSELRDEPTDLPAELRQLVAESRGTRVHLELGERLPAPSADGARALVRGAREAITNASRHGRAANVWLGIASRDDGLALTARDDGAAGPSGAAEIRPGHGLTGITARARDCGGRTGWKFRPQGGFELEIWVPAARRSR